MAKLNKRRISSFLRSRKMSKLFDKNKLKEGKKTLSEKFYDQKITDGLSANIENCNFLIENILEKNNVVVEKNYNHITITLNSKDSKNDFESCVDILLYEDYIELKCENRANDYYESITIRNTTLYTKWYDILIDKYIEYINKKYNDIYLEICKATKLDRKNKIKNLNLKS